MVKMKILMLLSNPFMVSVLSVVEESLVCRDGAKISDELYF